MTLDENSPASGTAGAGPQSDCAVLTCGQFRPGLPAPAQPEELQPTAEQLRLEEARQLARDNPVAVASILKTWVNGD